jgi:DNA-binding MarR family transcriptional regulator
LKKSIGRYMSILHRQSQIHLNHSLKEFNITSSEYSFLLYLFRADGATQDEMSSYLYIDKAAIARSMKSLESKGYVLKIKDTTDKRYNRIYLTDKAKSNREAIRKKVWHWIEFLTDDLDEEITDVFLTVLEKMASKVEKSNLKKLMESNLMEEI